eukprot:753049-Hanusia_phi.AAC.2
MSQFSVAKSSITRILDSKDEYLTRTCSPRVIDETMWSNDYETDLSLSSAADTVLAGYRPARLVSYNIHGWRDTRHNDNFDRLISVLKKINPDVIALQEVLHPYRPPSDPEEAKEYFELVKSGKGNGFVAKTKDEKLPYLEALARALNLPFISFGQATDDGYFGKFGYGNAIVSKFPIVDESHFVVKPHPRHQAGRRIEAEDRCFSAVKVELEQNMFCTFCVTHLDQLSEELRVEQVAEMMSSMQDIGPHILCGDFNAFQRSDCSEEQWNKILDDAKSKGWTPPPETTQAVSDMQTRGYVDCFYQSLNHVEETFDPEKAVEGMTKDTKFPGPTCWVEKPLLRIDYVWLSKGLQSTQVLQYQRVMDDASDHYPVFVDLVICSDKESTDTSSCESESDNSFDSA